MGKILIQEVSLVSDLEVSLLGTFLMCSWKLNFKMQYTSEWRHTEIEFLGSSGKSTLLQSLKIMLNSEQNNTITDI